MAAESKEGLFSIYLGKGPGFHLKTSEQVSAVPDGHVLCIQMV